MKFRTHHLICRLGFQGEGYDERFSRVMEEVLAAFKLNPKLELKVSAGPDILCAACPHLDDKGCEKEGNQVKRLDEFVLSRLGLKKGAVYSLEEIDSLIREKFEEEDRKELCRDCEWDKYGYCREGLEDFKN